MRFLEQRSSSSIEHRLLLEAGQERVSLTTPAQYIPPEWNKKIYGVRLLTIVLSFFVLHFSVSCFHSPLGSCLLTTRASKNKLTAAISHIVLWWSVANGSSVFRIWWNLDLDIQYELMDLSSRIRKLADRHIIFSPVLCVQARAQFLFRSMFMKKDTTLQRINSLFKLFGNKHADYFGLRF